MVSTAEELNDRMHVLLERNTDGMLNEIERAELETLVQMAQFAQLLAMSVHPGTSRNQVSARGT